MTFIDNQSQNPSKKKDADKFKGGTPKSSDNRATDKKVVVEKTGFLRKYKKIKPPEPQKPKMNWSKAAMTKHPNEPEIRVLSGGATSESVEEITPEKPKAKKLKGRPKKGLGGAASMYDTRIGVVPSGGIGITSYTTESKTFSDIRKKNE